MRDTINSTQDLLRDAFTAFWGEQLTIEPEGKGLAVAMPLMDATGWQVVLHLEPLTGTHWAVGDRGATLGMLDDAGKNLDAGKFRDIIDAQCRFYGFERDGLVLSRTVRFPFDAAEIQIFAEGLVALSHLVPKTKKDVTINTLPRMEDRISSYFHRRQWHPERRRKLSGKVESDIVVEYYWEGLSTALNPRPIALQPVGRTAGLKDYMEKWAWRWTDLKNANPKLIKAMVFDPDAQAWDRESRNIGEQVCDIFVPIFEAEEALDKELVA